jgi:putative transcriptional regulator
MTTKKTKSKGQKLNTKHSKAGASILKSLNEAMRWAAGEDVPGVKAHQVRIPSELDVKAIRTRLGMSQNEFAHSFGFSASTLRNWEQGTRKPETTARILLTIIERAPAIVQRVLNTPPRSRRKGNAPLQVPKK